MLGVETLCLGPKWTVACLTTWAHGGMLEVIWWSSLTARVYCQQLAGGLLRAFLRGGGSDQIRAHGAVVIIASLLLWQLMLWF